AGPFREALERVMAEQVETPLEERMATVGLVHALGVAALAGEEQCDRGRHQGHCTPSDHRGFRVSTPPRVCVEHGRPDGADESTAGPGATGRRAAPFGACPGRPARDVARRQLNAPPASIYR